MSKNMHRVFIYALVGITTLITVYLFFRGWSYYATGEEERFYHADHTAFKPSGLVGHGLGIVGTLLILIGVFLYMARKRYKSLGRLGRLKHWLEFHIFLCSLGPILVLFHTSFKFGGIVSISFWSMVAVVASGVIGRFIYIQIPRSIEGRELSLQEVQGLKRDLSALLEQEFHLDSGQVRALLAPAEPAMAGSRSGNLLSGMLRQYLADQRVLRQASGMLRRAQMPGKQRREILKILKQEISLNHRIERLQTMQRLFKYWHVAHLPFALIMLIIMVIHVGVTLAFGYRWIF